MDAFFLDLCIAMTITRVRGAVNGAMQLPALLLIWLEWPIIADVTHGMGIVENMEALLCSGDMLDDLLCAFTSAFAATAWSNPRHQRPCDDNHRRSELVWGLPALCLRVYVLGTSGYRIEIGWSANKSMNPRLRPTAISCEELSHAAHLCTMCRFRFEDEPRPCLYFDRDGNLWMRFVALNEMTERAQDALDWLNGNHHMRSVLPESFYRMMCIESAVDAMNDDNLEYLFNDIILGPDSDDGGEGIIELESSDDEDDVPDLVDINDEQAEDALEFEELGLPADLSVALQQIEAVFAAEAEAEPEEGG